MRAVADPGPLRDPLARAHRGGMSHHGDKVAFASRLHFQDGEPVLGIVVGDPLDGPCDRLKGRCGLSCRLKRHHM